MILVMHADVSDSIGNMSTQTIPHEYAVNRPVIEPRTQAFLDSLAAAGGPPLEELSVEEARAEAARGQTDDVAKLPADIEDRTIPGGPTGEISIRIVRPKESGLLPAVMYFHGGGWVLNDRESFDRSLREIANRTGAAVVFVEYTRSPEARR
jgi:acetyl esterase